MDEYGDYLFRYALLRIRDHSAAEDLVQETLVAALRSRDRFVGRSSFRTWLVAILKRKIMDALDHTRRERSTANCSEMDTLDVLFDDSGKWRSPPPVWADPGIAMEKAEFWEVFHRCLAKLPLSQGQAFALRELEELTTEEACGFLNITGGNFRILLHRARLGLWRCLSLHWFGETKS